MKTLWPIIVTVIALAAAGFSIYNWGKADQKTICVTDQAAADHTGEVVHDKIEQDIIRLADPDLDKRLDKWMRD